MQSTLSTVPKEIASRLGVSDTIYMIFSRKNMPPAVNEAKNNILRIELPYHNLKNENTDAGGNPDTNWVIFWGANFKDLPDIDNEEFIKRTNLCLDFVRRECSGYHLIYKLHPAETDEYKMVNLDGFEIVGTDNVGEFYLLQNIKNIKYTFSALSAACISAHKLGIPSFVFIPLFESMLRPDTVDGYREYFSPLPRQALISDYNSRLVDYKITPVVDGIFENNFKNKIGSGSGKIFFIAETPGVLSEIISLVNLVKSIFPERKVGLLVCRHHRWDIMNFEDLRPYFDSIDIFTRTFYSLRPAKLIMALRVAKLIKNFDIESGDVLIGTSFTSFVEDCFMSYYKRNKKILFLNKVSFDSICGPKRKEMLAKINYKNTWGALFYNFIFEPLLVLHRTIYMDDPGRVMNFRMYQRPLNDIYDQVYLF